MSRYLGTRYGWIMLRIFTHSMRTIGPSGISPRDLGLRSRKKKQMSSYSSSSNPTQQSRDHGRFQLSSSEKSSTKRTAI